MNNNNNKNYAPVIGSQNNYVRVGTKDEYLYWRVFHRVGSDDIGTAKKFYLSPTLVPGYEEWGFTPYWQNKIYEWEQRRNQYLNELEQEYLTV